MAMRYVWMAALFGVSVACAGGEFVDAPGAAGSGGSSVSGGSSGSGGSGGSSATGGSTSGGSGGTSSGGAGGTGGGGALCPVAAPLTGSPCPKLGHICSYAAPCCQDEYECSIDGWVYNRCVGSTTVAACPSAVPTNGASCDVCVDQSECVYVNCAQGIFHASCDANAWTVSQTSCPPQPSCVWGSAGFAAQFVKDCASDADCVTATILNDCYATLLVVGVNAADAARLGTTWAGCATSSLTLCATAPDLPRDESGATATDPAFIGVKCVTGMCTSSVTGSD